MDLNPSVIFFTDGLDADAQEAFAIRLEELGYESLWVPEFFGREPFRRSPSCWRRRRASRSRPELQMSTREMR